MSAYLLAHTKSARKRSISYPLLFTFFFFGLKKEWKFLLKIRSSGNEKEKEISCHVMKGIHTWNTSTFKVMDSYCTSAKSGIVTRLES